MAKTTAKENVAWNGNADLFTMLVPLGDLSNDPKNINVHNERSITAIAASMAEFGQTKPIVALKNGVVIAGNGTLMAAKQNKWTHIAVSFFEDEAKARAYAIADNRTSELSAWDEDELAASLEQLSESGFSMDSLGFSMDEVMEIIGKSTEAVVQPVEAIAGEQRENEYQEKSTTGSKVVGEPSHVRMIQLFFNEETHPIFMDRIRSLAVTFDTDNVTDAVFEAVRFAYENSDGEG